MTDSIEERLEACRERTMELKGKVDISDGGINIPLIEPGDFDNILEILDSIEVRVEKGDYSEGDSFEGALTNVEDSLESMEALFGIYWENDTE